MDRSKYAYVYLKRSFPLINRNSIFEFLITSNANEIPANLQPIQPIYKYSVSEYGWNANGKKKLFKLF